MKLFNLKRLWLLSLCVFGISLSGCSFNSNGNRYVENSEESVESKTFTLEASSDVYYLDKSESITIQVKYDGTINAKEVNSISLTKEIDTASSEITNYSDRFTYHGMLEGETVLVGTALLKNGTSITSSNKIRIQSKYSANKIKERINNALTNNPVFGKTYNVGISKAEISNYKIEGADGILRIDSEGQLEVCGFGRITPKISFNGEILFDRSCQIFISMICTEIRNILFDQNKIQKRNDNVTNDLLQYITEINMDGYIVNDQECALCIKYLTNLEELDLSNNFLTNIDFLSDLNRIKRINFSHNYITDLSPLFNCENSMEEIDFSDNNATSLNALATFTNLKVLNLSNNKISNIDFLSGVDSLEKLNLNNNTITKFKDGLSGLYDLKELSIGYTGLNFVDIRSLTYLNQLEYLDISGSSTTIDQLRIYSNLHGLRVADCNLFNQNLSTLSNLNNLKLLDISNNQLMDDEIDRSINSESLSKIEELYIGGNEFTNIPQIVSNLQALKILDLTNSYNVVDIACLENLGLEELILDECNSIGNDLPSNAQYANTYMRIINSLTNLEKLSIVGALNYLTIDVFRNLEDKVYAGELSLRFLEDGYVDKDTISIYSSNIFFNMETFLQSCQENSVGQKVVPSNIRHIILSLVNDDTALSLSEKTLIVPKTIRRIDLYGKKDAIYNFHFILEDRKESSLTFSLISFVNKSSVGTFYEINNKDAKIKVLSKNGSYCIEKLPYTFNNCKVDNGWNPNQKDNESFTYELKSDLLSLFMTGVVHENGSYHISNTSKFRVYGVMLCDYDKVPFKDGRNQYRNITNDNRVPDQDIYGTTIKPAKGYGQACGYIHYKNGSKAQFSIENFFEGKLKDQELIIVNNSTIKNNDPITKIEIVIVFEIYHHQINSFSDWRYDLSLQFIN